MERHKAVSGALQQRFAQILSPLDSVPNSSFGEVVLSQNKYAISYEDSARKIPEWARLRLNPHKSKDMHGEARTSYMVVLRHSDEPLKSELNDLMEQHEKDGISIAAVHNVKHISEHGSSNGKGRIIRTIKPDQLLYYSSMEPHAVGFPENVNSFRQTIMAQLTRSGSHDSLQDYKHIVQAVKRNNKPEYQYALPAELPVEFIDRIRNVDLEVTYGRVKKQVTFTIARHEAQVLPFRSRSVNDPKETGMSSTYRLFELHKQLDYLRPSIHDADMRLIHFESPSTTCAEKLKLLRSAGEWTTDNIFAAHFYDSPEGHLVLVGPRLGDVINPEHLLERATGLQGIRKSGLLPDEMENGTCTPFVYSSTIGKTIAKIVLLELPDSLMVHSADYSIGGHGPSAHRASIQTAPVITESILKREFPHKVVSFPHPYESYW